MYTLGQAAEATGKQKSTILKAIRSGRVSGKKNEKGEWDIDPSELHRVYDPVSRNSSPKDESERESTDREALSELIELRVKVEVLQQQLNREREINRDLSRRLDQADEERRKLTLMLTDQRPAQETRASFWRQLFRKS